MEKKNYNSMYRSKVAKEEVETAPVEELSKTEDDKIVIEEIEGTNEKVAKHELPRPEDVKIEKQGSITGDLNLNVRNAANGEIIDKLVPGTKVIIVDEQDEWYKISAPVEGFIMKKFVEV